MLFGFPFWAWILLALRTFGGPIALLIWALLFDKYIWNQEKVIEVMGEKWARKHFPNPLESEKK